MIIDTDTYRKKLEPILKKMEECADELRALQADIEADVDLADDVREQLKYAIDRMSEQY